MLPQVVVSFSKYSPWHPARLSSAGTSLHHSRGRRRRSCFVLQFPTGCLIAIPANCPNASRRVVNDWDCNGSCHLKFFDHPRKPIKSVARLQFAGGHIGQFRENDRRIIHSVWYFKSPPVGSESSDLESATKAVYFAFRNSAKAQDAYAYFLYHQPLGPLMNPQHCLLRGGSPRGFHRAVGGSCAGAALRRHPPTGFPPVLPAGSGGAGRSGDIVRLGLD